MGRTSFPQNTSSIRTMDFSRDFGVRRSKILSSHRVSSRWKNHTPDPWGYIKILQGSVARRESRRFTHVRTQKIRLHFRGSGTLGLSKLSDILAGPFTFSIRTMHCRYRTIQYKDNVFSKRPILPAQIPQEFRGMDVWNPDHKYKQM